MNRFLVIYALCLLALDAMGQHHNAWWINYDAGTPSYSYDSVKVSVSADAYDLEERLGLGSGIEITSSDLEINAETGGAGTEQLVGLQFLGISIPAGATIDSAFVQFQLDTPSGTAGGDVEIWAEDAYAPVVFTSTTVTADADYFSSMYAGTNPTNQATTAKTQWLNLDGTAGTAGDRTANERTTNFAAVIQELVDRGDWSATATRITIVFSKLPAGDFGEVEFEAQPNGAAELQIYYKYIP